MKKFSKTLSLGMILVFILTIFTPYCAKADGALTPSLSMDTSGNYIVASVADLNKLRSDIDKGIDYSGKNVVLTQDIDISKSTEPLQAFTNTNTFNGTFNGKFHTISSYTDKASGLFAFINKDAVVENVRIDANVVISDYDAVIQYEPCSKYYGLIANRSEGKITRCSTTGTIETTTGILGVAGIVGDSSLNIYGDISDCYSNITFKSSVPDEDGDGYPDNQKSYGISANLYQIEHCYFGGKFLGQSDKNSINPIGDMVYNSPYKSIKNCAYDKDTSGYTSSIDIAKGCTTAEMKNKDTYIALGFDFDKTWKMDPSVNDGYPYLNPENENKVATTIPVNVQITAEDKTYDTNLSVADNLKTKVKDIKIVAESSENEALIAKYNVTATYDGDVTFSAPTIGDVPVNFDLSKVKLTNAKNDDYKFVLSKALPSTAKLKDNGAPGPRKEQQKEQIENAKKAQDILYKKLEIGQGAVPEFTWSGDKAPAPEQEGTIIFMADVWGVFSAARSGYKGVRQGYYDDWFKSVRDGLKKMKAAGITVQDVKMTEWEKLVLAITAVGYDPRDIEAYDLIDIISNNDYLKVSIQIFKNQYAVFALNSYNYAIPKDGNHINLEDLIHEWAKPGNGTKGADGSIVLENMAPDMWTMGFQPIAAYYNPNAKEGDKYYDVKQNMNHRLDQISNSQTYKGFFYGGYSYEYSNPWTNAQVYITLGMAHVDIFDKKFIKNGKSILDDPLESYDIEKGTTKIEKNSYEPAQMGRGLESLIRAYEGRNSIFDCTDVKDSTVPVNNAIKALPENITSDNKAEVAAARALYDGLSDAKKASIKDEVKAKLTAAEEKVNQNPKPTSIEISNLNASSTFKLGNDVKVSVKAVNNSDKDQDGLLVVALYDENNKFAGYACGKNNIKKGDSAVLTSMMKLPKEGTYKMKAFVCDSLENMNPISNVVDIPLDSNK
ncbi:cell surface protein [Clostridium aciditolerans]|uniref:Cell surface protein n=1 Tax=Clostridium aciditolerans TaxID=339861 RepID=A0A934M2F4_9CLOT|nr:cell surface protein [Clostridium aciditolerans]MBI6871875.1 cell surface protein [Clostridium aciditolerans]